MARRSQWTFAPDKRKQAKPKVSAAEKAIVKQQADSEVVPTLREQHVKPPPEDDRFNYIEGIDTKWYRHYFYFFATYCVPGPNAISPSFESKFARMEYLGKDSFNLAFMRHTEEWVTIQSGSADECFQEILAGGWFTP